MASDTPFWGAYSPNEATRPGWQRILDRAIPYGTSQSYRTTFGPGSQLSDRVREGSRLLGIFGPAGSIAGRLIRGLVRNYQNNNSEYQYNSLSPEDREILGVNSQEEFDNLMTQVIGTSTQNGYNLPVFGTSIRPAFTSPMTPAFPNPTEQPSMNPTVTVGDINTGFGPVMPMIDQNTGQVYNNSFPGVTGPYTHTPTAPSNPTGIGGTNWGGVVMPYLQPSDEPNTSGLPGITSPLSGSGYGPSGGSGNTGWVSTAGNYGAGVGAYGAFHGVGGNSPSYQSGVSPYFSPYIEY